MTPQLLLRCLNLSAGLSSAPGPQHCVLDQVSLCGETPVSEAKVLDGSAVCPKLWRHPGSVGIYVRLSEEQLGLLGMGHKLQNRELTQSSEDRVPKGPDKQMRCFLGKRRGSQRRAVGRDRTSTVLQVKTEEQRHTGERLQVGESFLICNMGIIIVLRIYKNFNSITCAPKFRFCSLSSGTACRASSLPALC